MTAVPLALLLATLPSAAFSSQPPSPDRRPAEPVYEALGFLNEYTGRFVTADSDTVEWFYPAEVDVAEMFRVLLSRVARDHGLPAEVRMSREEGGHTVLLSEALARLLNGMYLERRAREQPDGSPTVYDLRVSDAMFASVERKIKIAYLAGAYRRYGRGNAIGFANAEHKAIVIERLLRDVGCTGVRRESIIGRVPNTNIVRFDRCQPLMDRVGRIRHH
jgi:hypothetical protein